MPTLNTFEAKIHDVSQQGDHASVAFRRWQGPLGPMGPVQHHRFPIDEPFGAAMLALALEHPWVRVTIDDQPQPARVIEVVRLGIQELGEHHHTVAPGQPSGVRLVRDAPHTYAEVGHAHAGYAPAAHQHAGYAAEGHAHAGYAPTTHAHAEYAPTAHQHPGYAPAAHDHAGYAPAAHEHAYASTTHGHTDYAAATHGHADYAAATHEHAAYAPTAHAHAQYAPVERFVTSQHALTIEGGRPVTGHVRLADLPVADPNLPTTSEQARLRRLRLVYAEIQPQATETVPCFTTGAITTTFETVDDARVWMAGVSATLMRHTPKATPTQVVATGNQPVVYTLSLCLAYT